LKTKEGEREKGLVPGTGNCFRRKSLCERQEVIYRNRWEKEAGIQKGDITTRGSARPQSQTQSSQPPKQPDEKQIAGTGDGSQKERGAQAAKKKHKTKMPGREEVAIKGYRARRRGNEGKCLVSTTRNTMSRNTLVLIRGKGNRFEVEKESARKKKR